GSGRDDARHRRDRPARGRCRRRPGPGPRRASAGVTTIPASAPEATGGRQFDRPAGNWIDGRWQAPVEGRWLDAAEPSTTEVFSRIPASGAPDVEVAVTAARRSFADGGWSRITPSERGRAMWRLASLIRDHTEALAWTEMQDSGKPIREAREDMAGVA